MIALRGTMKRCDAVFAKAGALSGLYTIPSPCVLMNNFKNGFMDTGMETVDFHGFCRCEI